MFLHMEADMAKKDAKEAIFELLQTGDHYSFRELAEAASLTKKQCDAAIASLRKEHRNIRFGKFSKRYYLDKTPTPYYLMHDHTDVPTEGVVGLISDTHYGSTAERLDLMEVAYDTFMEREVETVYHSGDLIDGQNVYPGHNNHIHCIGDDQLAYVMKTYPRRESITTYHIAGNHCLSVMKKSGVDPMTKIATGFENHGKWVEGREDMVYLGQMATQILWPQEVIIDILHPDGGNVYAKSYKIQKRSESMNRETRPDLQITGHYHDFCHCWIDGTCFIAMPGMQDATEFFRRRGFSRQVGFCLLHYKIHKGRLVYAMPELHMFG